MLLAALLYASHNFTNVTSIQVGKGGYGCVYLVQNNESKKYYVLKEVNIRGIPHEEQQNALKEVAILRKLRHPNIIAYKDSYVEAGNLAIIMEFAQVLHRR